MSSWLLKIPGAPWCPLGRLLLVTCLRGYFFLSLALCTLGSVFLRWDVFPLYFFVSLPPCFSIISSDAPRNALATPLTKSVPSFVRILQTLNGVAFFYDLHWIALVPGAQKPHVPSFPLTVTSASSNRQVQRGLRAFNAVSFVLLPLTTGLEREKPWHRPFPPEAGAGADHLRV